MVKSKHARFDHWPASVISWSSVGVWAPRRRRPGCVDRSLAPMRPSRALQETSHIVFVTSPRNLSREEGIIDNADVSLVSSVVRRIADINVDPEIRFLPLEECCFSPLAVEMCYRLECSIEELDWTDSIVSIRPKILYLFFSSKFFLVILRCNKWWNIGLNSHDCTVYFVKRILKVTVNTKIKKTVKLVNMTDFRFYSMFFFVIFLQENDNIIWQNDRI